MKRDFNPSSSIDISELKFFIKYNKWKNNCPFKLKFPYLDVPTMCKDLYVKYKFDIK